MIDTMLKILLNYKNTTVAYYGERNRLHEHNNWAHK